jgi:hypothetical protein
LAGRRRIRIAQEQFFVTEDAGAMIRPAAGAFPENFRRFIKAQ